MRTHTTRDPDPRREWSRRTATRAHPQHARTRRREPRRDREWRTGANRDRHSLRLRLFLSAPFRTPPFCTRNAQRAMQRAPERQPAPQSASSEGRRRTRYARRGSKTTPYSRIGADSESPLSLPIRGSYDALLLHKVQDEATHSHGDRKHQEQHIHGMLPSPCGRQRNVDPDR